MNAVDLLRTLHNRGVTLWSEGEILRYKAPKFALDAVALGDLRENKAELLKLISPPITGALKRSRAPLNLDPEAMKAIVDVFRQLRKWRDERRSGHSRTDN